MSKSDKAETEVDTNVADDDHSLGERTGGGSLWRTHRQSTGCVVWSLELQKKESCLPSIYLHMPYLCIRRWQFQQVGGAILTSAPATQR